MRYLRRPLVAGDRFRIEEGGAAHEVIRVGEGSAIVRASARVRKTILADDGTVRAAFDAPQSAFSISLNSFVFPEVSA